MRPESPTTPDRLDPERAAVIVIDLQNDFCHPDGLQARQGRDVSRVQDPVAQAVRLMDAAHAVGVPVFVVQNQHSPESDTAEWLHRHPDPQRAQTCQIGTWGAEFYGFTPTADDRVVTKTRYSAFVRTTLEQELRAIDRNSLLFAGVTTGTCVESSVRDAVCLDFLATVVADCCGAYTDEAHERSLASVRAGFGAVCRLDDVVDRWRQDERSAV